MAKIKENKVLKVIFIVATLVLSLALLGSLYGDLVVHLDETGENIIGSVNNFTVLINEFNAIMAAGGPQSEAEAMEAFAMIGGIATYGLVFIVFVAIAIRVLIIFIVTLVKGIKSFKQETPKDLIKASLAIAIAGFIYFALMSLLFQPEAATRVGWGPTVALIVAFTSLALSTIASFLYHDRETKVLPLILRGALVILAGLSFMLCMGASIASGNNTASLYFAVNFALSQAMSIGSNIQLIILLSSLGLAMIMQLLMFIPMKNILKNALSEDGKKGNIITHSVFFAILAIGSYATILIVAPQVEASLTAGFAPLLVAIFSAISLVGSIVLVATEKREQVTEQPVEEQPQEEQKPEEKPVEEQPQEESK